MNTEETCISDTHCHLSLMASDIVAKNIEYFQTFEHAFLLDVAMMGYPKLPEKEQAFLYHSAGIHPGNVTKIDLASTLNTIEEHADAICAIGETGLDAYKYMDSYELQCSFFEAHIDLAEKLGLPVIIHNRNADADVLKIHKGKCTGVLHCFSSSAEIAYKALDAGLCLSFAGNLTYKKNELRELIPKLPAESLLVETDSPFLAPQAVRGTKNEPSNVVHTAEVIAKCLNMERGVCQRLLFENALRLFAQKE